MFAQQHKLLVLLGNYRPIIVEVTLPNKWFDQRFCSVEVLSDDSTQNRPTMVCFLLSFSRNLDELKFSQAC